MQTVRMLGIVTLGVWLVHPALRHDSAASPAPTEGAGRRSELGACLLVVAGSGAKALSEKVTQFWQAVNAEVATSLVEQLAKDGVAARLELLPQDAAPEAIPGLVATGLARERCRQLMQLTHELGGGSGPDAYFAFEAALFQVQEAEGGFTLGREAFRKKYRHALTQDTMKNLSLPGVASTLKADLAAAGVLVRAPAQ